MAAQLKITVIPKSNRTEVAGRRGDNVLLRVTSVPEGGKANEAVQKLLSKAVGVPKTSITIVKGHTSRQKTVEFSTLDQPQLDERVTALLGK